MVGGDVTYGGSYDGGEAHMVGGDVTYGGSYGDQEHSPKITRNGHSMCSHTSMNGLRRFPRCPHH